MQKQSLNPALKKWQSKNSLTYDLTLKSLSKERQAYFEKLHSNNLWYDHSNKTLLTILFAFLYFTETQRTLNSFQTFSSGIHINKALGVDVFYLTDKEKLNQFL